MSNTATSERYQLSGRSISPRDLSARRLVVRLLQKLNYGTITIYDGTQEFVLGSGKEPAVAVYIHDPSTYRRVLFGGSIGAGEAYVDGLWHTDDLTGLVRIMVRNMRLLDRIEKGLAWFMLPFNLTSHIFNRNTKKGSKRNISAHYDLGNEMYRSFLDPSMMYSSAIYPEKSTSLEYASRYKLEEICRKLDLKATDKVIEIGSGWGGFAIHAATNYGCHVTTTTISDEQYNEAATRIKNAGLSERITLLKNDYRELKGQYDKLVSIEMIEAVGHRFLPQFFKKCGELLKDDGIMLLQAITIRDQKYQQYVRGVDFIQRHIFPGGCLPSNTRMVDLLTRHTDMVVRHLEDFGRDYARTLSDWRKRFLANFSSLKSHGYDERFRRLWEFYLGYCEGGFLEQSISVVHLVANKPNNRNRFYHK